MHPPISPAELALVSAAQSGNSQAFAQLIRRNKAQMRAVIHKMMHRKFDEFQVDEVLAAAQARVWRALASFKGDSLFSTWCHRIAINCALTAMRDSKKRYAETPLEPTTVLIRFSTEQNETGGQSDSLGYCVHTGQSEPDAEEKLEQHRTLAAVADLLGTVQMCDPQAHAVFYRHRVDGEPLIRLAAELGITRAKARAHVKFVDSYLRENMPA